jgi:O-antigen/teichoic acid export membrane protein
MAANMIFSHYFSGVNLPKHNLYGSVVGLLVTIPSIYILIPKYGIIGAGISVSFTYLATIIYQWIIFKKETKVKTIQLLPTLNDFKTLVESIKKQFIK